MKKRPIGVGVIAWIILILSLFGILGFIYVFSSPGKLEVLKAQFQTSSPLLHYVIVAGVFNIIVNFILSIFMLKGANWSRHVFLIVNAILLVAALILMPSKLAVIIRMIIFLFFLCFLYNTSANVFFSRTQRCVTPDEDLQ